MSSEEHKELVPINRSELQSTRQRPQLPAVVDQATRSLALFTRSPLVRRAAAVGLAFGAGWQLNKSLREGQLAKTTDVAQAVSRFIRSKGAGSDPPRVAWVRRSFMYVSIIHSRHTDQDEKGRQPSQ